jgi:hypothetical protein
MILTQYLLLVLWIRNLQEYHHLFVVIFCFLGFLSLGPISLPHFKRGINSFAIMLFSFPSGISILDEAFATRKWDLTIFLLLVKTSSN